MRKFPPAQVSYWDDFFISYRVYVTQGCQNVFKGAVSRNSAKLGHYKMPVKLGET